MLSKSLETYASVAQRNEEIPQATDQQNRQFLNFSVLWSIATLFHMAYSNSFVDSIHYIFLSLAAVYVLFNPGHLAGFLGLVTLQLCDVIFLMPNVSNHWLFTAFVNITIIQTALYLVIRKKTFDIAKGEFYETFARIGRIEVIILYFYAVFQKLNAGFFTPELSCASVLLDAQNLDWLIPVTSQVKFINAYFTILIEAIIPVFLCIRKTRKLGILIGLIFHCILGYSSYNAYYDFSSMVFALYFLFAPGSFSDYLSRIWRNVRSSKYLHLSYSFRNLVVKVIAMAAAIGVLLILSRKFPDFKLFHLYFFWALYSTIYILLFIGYIFRDRSPVPRLSFSIPSWSFAIVPFIVFLNGFSPYLGLKTENSFSMFSNLRTEGGVSNHYLIPASLQVFNYQKDLVEVISTTDPVLDKIAKENKLMVYFTFKDMVAIRRPQKVEYLLNGQKKVFDLENAKATNDPLLQRNSLLMRNLFSFRLISKFDPQPCAH